MHVAAIALVPVLLAASLAAGPAQTPSWSNAESPGGGPVQGLGGSSSVLVASTWTNGAYQSFDGGRHWSPIVGFPSVSEARVAFDPTDADVGYVYGFGGVAATTDGGLTWAHVVDSAVSYRLAIGPAGVVAASMRDAEQWTHVLLSHDHGATWTDVGFPAPNQWMSLYGLAFGATADDIVVMDISNMWVTHDGGATWTTQRHSFLDLARAPDGTLWASGFSVAKSADGGDTWTSVPAPHAGRPIAVGADGRVFLAGWGGLVTSADGGATWVDLGFGDAVWGATQMVVDPEDPTAVLVADEFIGIGRVSPAGYEGRTTGLQAIDVYALGAAADGSVLLAGGPLGVYASRDGGDRWTHTGAGAGFLGVTAVGASHDGSVLLGGGSTRVFNPFVAYSRDGGATWNETSLDLGGDGRIMGFAFDPADARHAFAAVTMDLANSKLIETTNGGASWRIALELPVMKIRDVAWDAAAGAPIVATEVGVLQYDGAGLFTPRGVTMNTWSVAAHDGRSWSNGPEIDLWSGDGGAPHAPWADAGAYVVDLSAESRDVVWAALVGGGVARCAQLACEDRSTPHEAQAVLVGRDGAVFAATLGGGIYRSTV